MNKTILATGQFKLGRLQFISLFTGAGGLDLGTEAAGFQSIACIEKDRIARNTILTNMPERHLVSPGDVVLVDPRTLMKQIGLKSGELDLLLAGPPCQPFSAAGRWNRGFATGLNDERISTLEAVFDFASAFLPRAILIENVPGLRLWGQSGARGLIRRRLSDINRRFGTNFRSSIWVLNALDFGVAQSRRRAFCVIMRNGKTISPPVPTRGDRLFPHATAWDAIGDVCPSQSEIEKLQPRGKWSELLASIPEGGNYIHLTPRGNGMPLFGYRTRYWAFLLKLAKDQPSWTLPASPGPATGPFHWDNRRLSVRELARLQTFPDAWRFCVSYRDIVRQIGNAVPPALADRQGNRPRTVTAIAEPSRPGVTDKMK